MGDFQCRSIVVVMEFSQIGLVPWALVTYDGGQIEKYNLGLVTGVVLSYKD